MLSDPSTKTPSSSPRLLSCGESFRSSPTSAAASGTLLASIPLATSNPRTDTAITGLSAHLDSISMSPSSPKGGCIIVDSTRKGKRFPDSMSKTIPIWACVLNRAIKNHLQKIAENGPRREEELNTSHEAAHAGHISLDWDCSLHLPLWVSKMEKAAIEDHLEEWTKQLEATGTDIASLALSLRKPLRTLWISPKTVIWLNEVPDCDSWDFTPVILVSASSSNGMIQQRTIAEFSWHYISGAGDDEESWARGLPPHLLWKNALDLINAGPDLCNQRVAEIVEKDRVYRAQRGESAPQVIIKPHKMSASSGDTFSEESNIYPSFLTSERSFGEQCLFSWLGSTNLAVGTTQHVTDVPNDIDCILNCDSESASIRFPSPDVYLHLPIVASKVDRFSLLNNLPLAVNFAKLHLTREKKLLVCCHNGEDISICVSLAILTSLYNDGGAENNMKTARAEV